MSNYSPEPGERAQAMEDERMAEQAHADKYDAQVQQEIDEFLAAIQYDKMTPAELEELSRLDELKHRYGRVPWEI